jgi:hypothetical protein
MKYPNKSPGDDITAKQTTKVNKISVERKKVSANRAPYLMRRKPHDGTVASEHRM